jgi:hypothetical protein
MTPGQSHELHPRAGQQRVFAGDATQEPDSSSDSGLVRALTADPPGKAALLHETARADGIHAIALGTSLALHTQRPGTDIIREFAESMLSHSP